MLISFLLILPLLGAVVSCLAAKRSERDRDLCYLIELVLVFLCALAGVIRYEGGTETVLTLGRVCALGLSFRMDGFRSCYTLIASFMWLMTGLASRQYFDHYRDRTRYYLFNQITLLGTLGLFLSDDLFTTFVFFEIMSLASYPWVAHEENPGAMHAAGTYLAVSVFGGMTTLMGLFLLCAKIGPLSFSAVAAARGTEGIGLSAALITVGFGAKAGLFPLYMWLPQAHPVAPAPASALLSGILTKTGVFGMLVTGLRLMGGDPAYGNVMLALGLITMSLGAVLALLSTNLKRILACSSMSQLGYITVGIAMGVLLGEEGATSVSGALMHMVSHSMLKLTLFMAAGIIYHDVHALELNDLRGYGRGKPMLLAAFTLGGLGLAGVPLLNGYPGKTLIHEGIVEYAAEWSGFPVYRICEWVFLVAAGITAAYMIKIWVTLFVMRHPKRQKEFDSRRGRYMNRTSAFALLCSMLTLPVLGCFPSILQRFTRVSASFTGSGGVSGVRFFTWEMLRGGLISLAIGCVIARVFLPGRLWDKKTGWVPVTFRIPWRESLPVRLVLKAAGLLCLCVDRAVENPLVLRVIPQKVAPVLCTCADRAVENPVILRAVPDAGTALFRGIAEGTDLIVLALRRTVFRVKEAAGYHAHTLWRGFSWVLGHILDLFAALLNLTIYRDRPIRVDFVYVLAARAYDRDPEFGRATRTVSFSLLLFALGMLLVLFWILL